MRLASDYYNMTCISNFRPIIDRLWCDHGVVREKREVKSKMEADTTPAASATAPLTTRGVHAGATHGRDDQITRAPAVTPLALSHTLRMSHALLSPLLKARTLPSGGLMYQKYPISSISNVNCLASLHITSPIPKKWKPTPHRGP